MKAIGGRPATRRHSTALAPPRSQFLAVFQKIRCPSAYNLWDHSLANHECLLWHMLINRPPTGIGVIPIFDMEGGTHFG